MAAAQIKISQSENSFLVSASILSAETTATDFKFGGTQTPGPKTMVGMAPTFLKALAKANPILPLELLEIYRTGSKYSRVGPKVIKTFLFLKIFFN